MNCKHGVSITDAETFTLTTTDTQIITCACCGCALRLSGPTATKLPPEHCNLCQEAEVLKVAGLSVNVTDELNIGEKL